MKFNSSRELASYFNVSEACISRWVGKGLPTVMGKRMSYEYELKKVKKWLTERSPRHRRWVEQLDQEHND